jgi:hydroxymethylpyrimidine/phosphomethylpyrimidine kinase
MNKILIIAGFDPSGGGGIIADQRAALFSQVIPFSVVTAITAQNTHKISMIEPLLPHVIARQLETLFEEFSFDAVKIGMVGTAQNAKIIADILVSKGQTNIVLDPVLSSTSGGDLLSPLKKESLVPLLKIASIITPNLKEAQFLTGIETVTINDMIKSGKFLIEQGYGSILIKGGHLKGDPEDLFISRDSEYIFKSKRIDTGEIRGTGCWLSTLIASNIAKNISYKDAVSNAIFQLKEKIKIPLNIESVNGILL